LLAFRTWNHYKDTVKHFKKKQQVLLDLEAALEPSLLKKMKAEVTKGDGTQYRPKLVEFLSWLKVLKLIQEEEMGESTVEKGGGKRVRSVRLTGSVGINMALDLEMRQ